MHVYEFSELFGRSFAHVVAAVHCEEIMGGIVEVWSKHGIQIMVLFSLVFQLLLFAIPIARRHSLLERRYLARLITLILWLVYQLADTTAIYALGHMAISSSPYGERRQLMAPWAALVLVHLVTDSSQNV